MVDHLTYDSVLRVKHPGGFGVLLENLVDS